MLRIFYFFPIFVENVIDLSKTKIEATWEHIKIYAVQESASIVHGGWKQFLLSLRN